MEDDGNSNQSLEVSHPQIDFEPSDGFSDFPPKGSIAERRAAKCGFNFNAARINTARFRTTSPLASPVLRSPCLTIPPGISPTALLDSPVMLPNSQALPSPTTGTLLLHPLGQGDGDRSSIGDSSFKFRPHSPPTFLQDMSTSENQGNDVDYQQLVPVHLPTDFKFPTEFPRGQIAKSCEAQNNIVDQRSCLSDIVSDESFLPKVTYGEDVGQHHVSEGDQKGTFHSVETGRTSEDGYNWRKYGQKQVKGSEYPRSYYKCTHPNCPVKKKVERSHDGQITEIIYKGAHNHAKPQPSRRASLGSAISTDEISDVGESSGTCIKVDGGSVWKNIQSGLKDMRHSLDWKVDGLEISSASVVTEVSDPLSTAQGKTVGVFESASTPEFSSTLASHDDDEDGTTQGSISLREDADDEESESKRRKKESCMIEPNLASRAVREPRVVVQIESEVDILDDGYRWRKYGQKVVKGNPNPRSYYKCTSAGCTVRKHVERASHNLKYVITTYEGKHNHEVPTARNSSQMSSGGGNVPSAAANPQASLTLPGSGDALKPANQVQGLPPHFNRKPEYNTDYQGPSFVGSFNHDLKFGPSSISQMKYSTLQSSMPYVSLGLNSNRSVTLQGGSIIPEFPMSVPLNLPSTGNFPLAGYNFNCMKPIGPVPSFLSGQQVKENDTRFIRPKQEHKDDPLDVCLPTLDRANASSLSLSSSPFVYHQSMGNFP